METLTIEFQPNLKSKILELLSSFSSDELKIVQEVEEKTARILAPKNFSKRIVLIQAHDEPEEIQGEKYHWSIINALSFLEE